jgi:hypothetical protein
MQLTMSHGCGLVTASNLLKVDAKRGCNQGAITPRITLGAKSGNPRRYFSSNYL